MNSRKLIAEKINDLILLRNSLTSESWNFHPDHAPSAWNKATELVGEAALQLIESDEEIKRDYDLLGVGGMLDTEKYQQI